ncbi:MAG: LuxR C-terminal-related transcriptional regulator [Pseudomonadota bacterium]
MSVFQTSKQIPVSLPEICAPRMELMQTFDRAEKTRCIYVQAPAGYGKTISTLLWLKNTDRKAIWISFDNYDNTPVLFYRLFCMSILAVIPHDEEMYREIKSPAFSAAPVEFTIDLLSRLSYEDCRYALVLDDFHLIRNEEIKRSLPYVLKRLPVTVTVIILSRNIISDSAFSSYGEEIISCIGTADLAFKSDEIRKHFASYGWFITKGEAENLHEYTEGWIIALNALAISGNIDVTYKNQELSFNSFIEKNIWNLLEKEHQEFLIKTSVPDRFSLELCEYLAESDKCKDILDTLIGSSINISLMGSEYRYHSLFLEFLRSKAQQSTMDIKSLNKRVADFYLKKGDYLTAKKFAAASGDIGTIMQVVRNFRDLTTFSLDEYIGFHRLYNLHSMPDALCDRMPLLYLPRIFFSYASGDVKNTNYLFDRLYPLLPVLAQTQPEIVEHVNSMIMLDCRIKLSDFSSRFNQLPAITQEHKSLQSPTFTLQLPFLHRCVRDFYELVDEEVKANVTRISSIIIKQNVEIMFRGAEAGLLLERNRLPEALEMVLALKDTINESMSPEFVYALYMLTAEIYLMMNRKDKHEAALKEAKSFIHATSSQYLLKNVSAYEARTAIMNGDKTAAEEWLKNYYVDDNSFNEFYKLYRSFTTARAYILLMHTDRAFEALNKLKALSESYDRLLDTAEADVLLAILEWIGGDKKAAQNRLLGVLSSIQPYGFTRVIANEGKAVLPILSSVIKRIEKDTELSEHLYKFVKEVYIVAYEQSKHFRGLTCNAEATAVKLSAQQKHILELLAKGHRNTEIVAVTGLSLNTIRTHTKAVYQKLEVNNVMDAILRAKQLGIIE